MSCARRHRACARCERDRCTSRRRSLLPGTRRRSHVERRSTARRDRPQSARRRDRPGDRRRRSQSPRHPSRLAPARGRASVGDRGCQRHLAADARRQVPGAIVAANILGKPREAHYEAVPRVVFTDPQAAAVGATEAAFSATARVSEVAKTAAYTRAYDKSNGFMTLLSDGERLTGAYALGPGGGRVAAASHTCDPRSSAARCAARHDPAVPDVLRDLSRCAESAAATDQDSALISKLQLGWRISRGR